VPCSTPPLFAAGERFRNDFTLAGLQPRVTSDWSNRVSGAALGDRGMHISDIMVGGARQRLDAALDAPELGSLILDVCGFLKGLETVETEHGWAGALRQGRARHRVWRVSRAITDWPRRRAGRRGHARLGERRLPPENLS
jgi:hypothetical protein